MAGLVLPLWIPFVGALTLSFTLALPCEPREHTACCPSLLPPQLLHVAELRL
jgi:hypothetical protein